MKNKLGTDDAIKRWDRNAEIITENYNEHGDLHREVLLNPSIFSLVGDVKQKDILDAGCGEGYLSRIFAKSGATVVAVDYSQNMLEIARKKTPKELNIEYRYGNCENLDFLEDESFDIIVSNMVIQDLENYKAAINEMYRLLVNGGSFVFSILHPCFVTPVSGWEKKDGEKLHWNVDNYFYEGVYEQSYPQGQTDKVLFFHRTLTSYFNAITEAGFILEGLIEPKPSAEMLEKHPSFEEDLRCSDFIVFKLRK
ncbi:class I SAM-dependent methyltransferase [Paenisporosarcina macmurdoensis]|uniref:Class I SAM-dependent methyltransferase n=1 Tax=Paenisporosarcina macmurdoensis TaxID=212659 RepID=A0ABW1LBP4_9BACL